MARVPATERREQFIDATMNVIARYGVRGATTRQIATEAGAPLAALHYCFSSKDELFSEVLASQTRSLIDRIPSDGARVGMAAAAVRIIETSAERCIRHRDWTISNLELEFWAQRRPAHEGEAKSSYEDYHLRVAEILEASCRKGDDPALAGPLSGLISVIVDGMNFQWFVYRDERRVRDDVARATAMIDRYLSVRRSATRAAAPSDTKGDKAAGRVASANAGTVRTSRRVSAPLRSDAARAATKSPRKNA